ncbi:putative nuclear transport factor 2 [Ditylenchus destructor]|nr:putative nuclear transport factor 2 [Ditylenchus destructor]
MIRYELVEFFLLCQCAFTYLRIASFHYSASLCNAYNDVGIQDCHSREKFIRSRNPSPIIKIVSIVILASEANNCWCAYSSTSTFMIKTMNQSRPRKRKYCEDHEVRISRSPRRSFDFNSFWQDSVVDYTTADYERQASRFIDEYYLCPLLSVSSSPVDSRITSSQYHTEDSMLTLNGTQIQGKKLIEHELAQFSGQHGFLWRTNISCQPLSDGSISGLAMGKFDNAAQFYHFFTLKKNAAGDFFFTNEIFQHITAQELKPNEEAFKKPTDDLEMELNPVQKRMRS